MTGYYPSLQDEELVLSTNAASVSMYLGDSNLLQERKRLLGTKGYSFGGIIPSHCRALQTNVPAIVGLTDEAILNGSAYHIVAPVLLAHERRRILKNIFHGFIQFFREIFPEQSTPYLQYCVACAREDETRGNRQCWRVLANIPGNNTCEKHGLLLMKTGAISGSLSIPHDARLWIDLKSPSIPSENKYDLQLSKDLRWLYNLKSKECPGWKQLSAALTVALAKRGAYRRSWHYLALDVIIADLRNFGEVTERISVSILNRVT